MRAILKNKIQYTDRDLLYVFDCPEIAGKAKAGQFVEVRVAEGCKPFLRRPISIFDAQNGELKLLVRTVGEGTRLMEQWECGQEADIIGPLGNGFSWDDSIDEVLLIGGGIGAAPMNFLIRELLRDQKKIHMIFLPVRDSALMKSMESLTGQIDYICCKNRHHLAEVLPQLTRTYKFDMVYCCGPTPLMEAVAEFCRTQNIESQISLEEKMGCGIGLCIGCVVAIRKGDDFEYQKVCHDGPVFSGKEVLFHV